MRAGATGRPKTKRTNCVQRRITTLADHYSNDEINLGEYLEALEKFLDKLETVNHWQCGLDLDLNTWKDKLLSRHQYNK
ncbi:unnamed protein product [Rotaria sp. Silwood1]|nr:unnamed protein product [Rotaria sp. Silwood1]CAF1471443.1 unnamed protein product [Rotaria sp. Silwood1]CAF3630141.1 unnamed protein product [Rotaria sp. Silwood1]CAF3660253.1 unnamed protein product [Rotaria sp. Silwood1]CAF4713257.1 unnamed protein product [Rotaria sp. Silwood1]